MSQNNLELNGDLHEHPLAELLVEISQAYLNGSLRIASEDRKAIIYFDAGEVVFAVSNAREHRLFNILLSENKITADQLKEIGNFTNDLELKNSLIEKRMFSADELNKQISQQIEKILQTALEWKDGKWNFSSLVRARAEMRFRIDVPGLLYEYARNLPNASLVRRFNSLQERFEMRANLPAHINLHPQEAFIFSRFGQAVLTVEEIKNLGGLSEIEVLKVLYTLWISGFLKRQKWNWAFTKEKIFALSTAKLSLKKNAPPEQTKEKAATVSEEVTKEKTEKITETFSLESYLNRVENAATFYEIFNVSPDASTAEIKSEYFSLAKRFHPDLFHRQSETEIHRRIQNAFTQLAHAYETLKDEQSREVYDFKLGKETGARHVRAPGGTPFEKAASEAENQASEIFEQGFSYFLEEDYETAIPFLARAAHLAGENARYHAYYGKALAADKNTYRQAEVELQTAIRLDAGNADYRLMLAELYINIGLLKRAEGELNRLLEKMPGNNEARALLDSLWNK